MEIPKSKVPKIRISLDLVDLDRKAIGEIVKHIREDVFGLSYEEFGSYVGKNAATIKSIEGGSSQAGLKILIQVVDKFKLNSYLVVGLNIDNE